MRTTLLLLAVLAGPALAAQTVWKWVDANGVTHYTDRPVPGATRMELSTGTSSSESVPPSDSSSVSSGQEDSGPPYQTLEIWRPSPEETIANTGGQVTVNVRIEPDLRSGDSIYLYLDGRLLEGFPTDAQSFDLTDIPRGSHTVVAAITNRRNDRIQQSDPVTFYVRQESVAQPPTGPALRPPPKPTPRPRN